jgi:hypothetical protein
MKKMIVAGIALFFGFTVISFFNSGCGSSNSSTAPAPVTVVAAPPCGAEYGFGANSASYSSFPTGTLYAYPITIGTATKTLSMSIHLGPASSGNITLCVYTDNGGAPATFVAAGTITSPSAGSWNTMAFNPPLVSLPAGNYWIGFTSANTINVQVSGTQTTNDAEYPQVYLNPFASYSAPMTASVFSGNPQYGLVLDTICQ